MERIFFSLLADCLAFRIPGLRYGYLWQQKWLFNRVWYAKIFLLANSHRKAYLSLEVLVGDKFPYIK